MSAPTSSIMYKNLLLVNSINKTSPYDNWTYPKRCTVQHLDGRAPFKSPVMSSRMLQGYTLIWISILIRNVIKNIYLYKTVYKIEITTRVYRGRFSLHSLFVGDYGWISAMRKFSANFLSFRCGLRTMKTRMSRSMSGFPFTYIRV